MKGKILSLAMALCMIALVFTALPSKGAVYYTGTVQTMDDTGMLKDVFFIGDEVYVNVTLYYENALVDADFNVQIFEQDGTPRDSLYATTDDPAVGYYNSTESVPNDWLMTNNVHIYGDMTICDVVLSVDTIYGFVEVARDQITVKNEALTLDPAPFGSYYPGQEIQVTIMTGSEEEFFVQVLDTDLHDLVPAWIHQTVDEDGVWTDSFTIPMDASDGTYVLEAREEVSDDYLFPGSYEYFYIAMFDMEVYSDREIVLPGETITVEYVVYDVASLSLYTDVETEWNAVWFNESGEEQLDTGELTPGYYGTEEFTIPEDINLTSDYEIHFWVNDTEDRTLEKWLTFSIGRMMGAIETDSISYLAGQTVNVNVDAWVEFEEEYIIHTDGLPDADVEIEVEKDGIVLPEYGATGLMTGFYGDAEHGFTIALDAEAGTYIVTATISKVGHSVVRMTTFSVMLSYSLTVELDKGTYYSGETATATFTTMWGAETLTNNSVFYVVYTTVGNLTFGNTSSGEASFDIPLDFVGTLEINAFTLVEDNYLYDSDTAAVSKAFIALAPTIEEYSAGDTIQWEFQIMTAMTAGLLSYVVEAAGGAQAASATIAFSTAGTISYTVPAQSPADSYEVTLTLKDGMGNTIQASSTVYLMSAYTISIWLESDSSFMSGAYEPGDEIEIGYEITTNGVAHKSVYRIEYYMNIDYVSMFVLTTSASGTLTLTVPDDATDGTYYIQVYLFDGAVAGWAGYLNDDSLQLGVLTGQSGWDKEVAGMSAIDFTILVLIIVMIVLLIVVPFLKGRSGPIFKKKAEPAPMTMPVEEPPPEPPPTQPLQ